MPKSATASFTIVDHGKQKAVVSVNMHNPAAGAGLDAIEADMNDIKLGIDALTTGSIRKSNLHVTADEPLTTPSTSASRENKWLVTYMDTTPLINFLPEIGNQGHGKLFSFEIPCADRAMLDSGTENLDLNDAYVATAIAHIEPNIRSPFNRAASGLTPTNEIISIRFVGRNL